VSNDSKHAELCFFNEQIYMFVYIEVNIEIGDRQI